MNNFLGGCWIAGGTLKNNYQTSWPPSLGDAPEGQEPQAFRLFCIALGTHCLNLWPLVIAYSLGFQGEGSQMEGVSGEVSGAVAGEVLGGCGV